MECPPLTRDARHVSSPIFSLPSIHCPAVIAAADAANVRVRFWRFGDDSPIANQCGRPR